MPHSQHALVEEFPDRAELIRSLIRADDEFAAAAVDYNEVNGEILRIEAEIETTSDEYLETLKKKRLRLLDDIHEKLSHNGNTGT
ncbi:MAG: DUF465 domain-containing protein [Siculibacillus sp.]|nr:DUF465 domain-containing protein [Siculibacillus sp.]